MLLYSPPTDLHSSALAHCHRSGRHSLRRHLRRRHLPVVERSDGSDRLLGMVDVLQLT